MSIFKVNNMKYKHFGNSGLKIPIISVGNMINYQPENAEVDQNIIRKCLENGINHFDTAEIYGGGECQKVLGQILRKIGVDRETVVIATKVHTANKPDINSTMSVNKKHVKQCVKLSLGKLQMDYVDIIYAHLEDNQTPLEEICRAFHQVIQEGLAFYWATSNWDAQTVLNAFAICEKLNLHKPIGAQNEYSMLQRPGVESEYEFLFKKYNYGLIAWSPLAGGFLTGKYLEGIKEDEVNRFTDKRWSIPEEIKKILFYNPFANDKTITSVKELQVVAEELKCKLVHLALAWVLKYPYTTSALIGARNVEQLEDCLLALDVLALLTPEVEARINKILNNSPSARFNYSAWSEYPPIRPVAK